MLKSVAHYFMNFPFPMLPTQADIEDWCRFDNPKISHGDMVLCVHDALLPIFISYVLCMLALCCLYDSISLPQRHMKRYQERWFWHYPKYVWKDSLCVAGCIGKLLSQFLSFL